MLINRCKMVVNIDFVSRNNGSVRCRVMRDIEIDHF